MSNKTRTLVVNPENPQLRLIRQAAECLRRGGVICYPTDTVYGMGCDIEDQKAVKRIYQLKRRPKSKPFSFMCGDLKDISTYCHVSNTAYRILKKNLPGPYTFVLPASKMVPKILITKQKTVGIRVPDNPICNALIGELGSPIITTSAIEIEESIQPVTEAFLIEERMGNQIDLIIDGGPVYPSPSTIVSLINDEIEILREGKGDISRFL